VKEPLDKIEIMKARNCGNAARKDLKKILQERFEKMQKTPFGFVDLGSLSGYFKKRRKI
jgi:hypothetical protein